MMRLWSGRIITVIVQVRATAAVSSHYRKGDTICRKNGKIYQQKKEQTWTALCIRRISGKASLQLIYLNERDMQQEIEKLLNQLTAIRTRLRLDILSQKSPYDVSCYKKIPIKNKFCHYCKTKILFNMHKDGAVQNEKAATQDHVYFKGDIRRALNKKTVPCCRKCNVEKNIKDNEWFNQGYEEVEYIKAGVFKISKLHYNGDPEIKMKEVQANVKSLNKIREKIKVLRRLNDYQQRFK